MSKITRRRKKKRGPFARIGDFFSRYTIAAAAGLTVVFGAFAFFLLSGGYIGLAAERVGRSVKSATASSGLAVNRITALGARETSRDEILRAVGPILGGSILHVDLHAARARVEELGWVRSAAVSRLLPDTIHVSVREREPAAIWQLSGNLHLIDASGAVIREVSAYEYSYLPLIVGAGAPDAAAEILTALRAEPALWGEAAALVRVGGRRWNLQLKSKADIYLPETGEADAAALLARVHAAYGLLDRPIEYIDLRDPSRFIYRERDGEEETLDAAL